MPAIQVVGAEAYLAGLNVVQETEECLTHIAQVRHPAHGQCTCYVKCYLEDRGPSKGLVNEVCRYILAEQVGLCFNDFIWLRRRPNCCEFQQTVREA